MGKSNKSGINIEYMRERFMNPDCSDITLVVEGKEFPVMSHFLAMHSKFFETLFYGNFEEAKKNKIALENVAAQPFKILLGCIYFGDMELNSTKKENLLELLKLAHFFCIPVALQKIEDHILKLPKVVKDVVDFVNVAALLNMEDLLDPNLTYIFSYQHQFIEKEVFVKFNEAALSILLDSDEWTIEEFTIIQRVEDWLNINSTSKREELLNKLRLPLVEADVLIRKIWPTKMFADIAILEALMKRLNQPNKFCRKILVVYMVLEGSYKDSKTRRRFYRHLYRTTSMKIFKIKIEIKRRENIYIRFHPDGKKYVPKYENNCYVLSLKKMERKAIFFKNKTIFYIDTQDHNRVFHRHQLHDCY